MPPPPTPSETKTHFLSIPWCANLLTSTSITIDPTPATRLPKPPTTENELFASTLATPATIPHCLSFHPTPRSATDPIPECHCLATLGSGVDGHAGVCHGGVVATVLDEVLGLLVAVNCGRGKGKGEDEVKMPAEEGGGAGRAMTAFLNVVYVRPVATPQTVVCSARFRLRDGDGRRSWVDGEMRDGRGEVLARAESLFLVPRSKL